MTTDVDAAEALRMARAVVGLYGDPDVTWGISLEATFEAPVDLTEVDARIAALVAEHPHLGVLPTLQRVAPQAWADERERSASAPFGDDGLLVRLLASEDATRFFVTAHHGVCDGLGLIAVMSAVVGRPLTSSARGVGDRTSSQSFLVSSVLRLGEALLAPPARFSGEGDPAAAGRPERLHQVDEPTGTVNGVRVCAALNSIHAAWPRRRTSGGRRFLVVMGASRRVPGETAPDRQTAYFRIALKPQWGLAEVKRALQEAEPEPTFPRPPPEGSARWSPGRSRTGSVTRSTSATWASCRGRGWPRWPCSLPSTVPKPWASASSRPRTGRRCRCGRDAPTSPTTRRSACCAS
ncbi:hypothetical protein [Nocardioides daphniae]|uniref:Condensation domain-containing protein n=1 Tax=Nocardioides daphniae TaxID=402297 RepID=A0A4P7UCI4_9ACTN|nr:hypothetical protein [Nocardioides daphniae]QCC77055.1 hypothetical protein E2C04_07215 [Nocardioides daphniae]